MTSDTPALAKLTKNQTQTDHQTQNDTKHKSQEKTYKTQKRIQIIIIKPSLLLESYNQTKQQKTSTPHNLNQFKKAKKTNLWSK